MQGRKIDWRWLAIGFLMGLSAILMVAAARGPVEPASQYRIATASSTWVINTATGDVWQICGEQGTSKYTWVYAGRPPAKDAATQGPDN